MNKRVDYIDIARGITILLVVYGHMIENGSIIKSMIYSFHMPLLFILPGLLYKKKSIYSIVESRFFNTYIPYFVWAMIFAPFSFRNIALIAYGTNESLLRAGSNGMLWFLPTLFVSNILFAIILNTISKLRKNKLYALLAVIALVTMSTVAEHFHSGFRNCGWLFSFDVVFLAAAFMIVGFIISDNFETVCGKLGNVSKILVSLMLVTVSSIAVTFDTVRGCPQMATLDVGKIPIYFAVAVFPSIGVIMLAKVIEKIPLLSKCLIWLGQNTMAIFILHRTVVYFCKDIYMAYSTYLIIPLFIVMVLYCCTGAVILNKFCPWIVGKQKNKV